MTKGESPLRKDSLDFAKLHLNWQAAQEAKVAAVLGTCALARGLEQGVRTVP